MKDLAENRGRRTRAGVTGKQNRKAIIRRKGNTTQGQPDRVGKIHTGKVSRSLLPPLVDMSSREIPKRPRLFLSNKPRGSSNYTPYCSWFRFLDIRIPKSDRCVNEIESRTSTHVLHIQEHVPHLYKNPPQRNSPRYSLPTKNSQEQNHHLQITILVTWRHPCVVKIKSSIGSLPSFGVRNAFPISTKKSLPDAGRSSPMPSVGKLPLALCLAPRSAPRRARNIPLSSASKVVIPRAAVPSGRDTKVGGDTGIGGMKTTAYLYENPPRFINLF